jgi:hypothetical protein
MTTLEIKLVRSGSEHRYAVNICERYGSILRAFPCVNGDVPIAQIAEFTREWKMDHVDTVDVFAKGRRISSWVKEWKPSRLKIRAVNCPTEAIHVGLSNLTLVVDELPRFDTPLRLEKLEIGVDRLPANRYFANVTFFDCFVNFLRCDELPVWCTRRYGKWHRGPDDLVGPDFDLLYHVLIQSLLLRGPFQRWLTKGLYDPRLLIQIVSFMIAWSDIISKSS